MPRGWRIKLGIVLKCGLGAISPKTVVTLIVFVAVAAVFTLVVIGESAISMPDEGVMYQMIRLSQQSAATTYLDQLPSGLYLLPHLGLSAWLIYIAMADVLRGEVSNWATLPLLFIVCLARLITGQWVLATLLGLVIAA